MDNDAVGSDKDPIRICYSIRILTCIVNVARLMLAYVSRADSASTKSEVLQATDDSVLSHQATSLLLPAPQTVLRHQVRSLASFLQHSSFACLSHFLTDFLFYFLKIIWTGTQISICSYFIVFFPHVLLVSSLFTVLQMQLRLLAWFHYAFSDQHFRLYIYYGIQVFIICKIPNFLLSYILCHSAEANKIVQITHVK